MIPLKVLNRLRLGRSVGAEVRATRPNRRAWVYVEPIIDIEAAVWVSNGQTPEQRLALDVPNAITGFRAGFIEIHEHLLEQLSDGNFPKDTGAVHIEKIAADEAGLEKILSQWLPDLSLLRHPNNVEYLSTILFRKPRPADTPLN